MKDHTDLIWHQRVTALASTLLQINIKIQYLKLVCKLNVIQNNKNNYNHMFCVRCSVQSRWGVGSDLEVSYPI